MSEAQADDTLAGLDKSVEYRIDRYPDVTTITPGADITYLCRWIGPGGQPEVASDKKWGPRDGVHWYKYSARPPRHFWQTSSRPCTSASPGGIDGTTSPA